MKWKVLGRSSVRTFPTVSNTDTKGCGFLAVVPTMSYISEQGIIARQNCFSFPSQTSYNTNIPLRTLLLYYDERNKTYDSAHHACLFDDLTIPAS